jgi:hypothetical protein
MRAGDVNIILQTISGQENILTSCDIFFQNALNSSQTRSRNLAAAITTKLSIFWASAG